MRHEWSSYLPDGRPIRVVRTAEGRWLVSCEGVQATGSDLGLVIEEAVELRQVVLPKRDQWQLREWISRHAEQMERETSEDA